MRRRSGGLLGVAVFSLARAAFAQQPNEEPSAPGVQTMPRGASGAALVVQDAGAPPPQAPAPVITPPLITPPTVKRDEGAQYPEKALKEGVREVVRVTVIVEIDAQGAVKRATVEAAAGHGFDEAAVEAANKLVFEPATRNGKPVGAKVKHVYEFVPPPSRIVGKIASRTDRPLAGASVSVRAKAESGPPQVPQAGAPTGPRPSAEGSERMTTTAPDGTFAIADLPFGRYHITATAPGHAQEALDVELAPGEEASLTLRLAPTSAALGDAKKEEEEVEEVVVHGERPPREVTKRTIDQREMSRIPGTNGDALRSLQNLPGVARPPAILGLLIVRGSAPQDTQTFIDGTLVPLIYHFGGLSSVVPTEMLEKIDFYPGNFSAQYGRGMGGIVDVGIRDPKKDQLHGLAQVDFIDARVLAEGPIGSSGWTFAVAGRRSYVDLWLKPALESSGAGVTTAPVYYDYQAIVARDFSKTSSARFSFFGSDDRLDVLTQGVNSSDPSLAGTISAHTGFWRAQARYKNRFSEDTEFRLMGAVGEDIIDFTIGDLFFKVTDYPITSRVELAQRMAQGLTMNVGMDMFYAPYTVHLRAPPLPRPGEPPPGPFGSRPPLETQDTDAIYRPALYDEFEIVPWRGGRLVPGIRVDYSKDTKSWDVQPRLSARQDVHHDFPRTTIKGGVGIYDQPPQPQETNQVFGIPGLTSNRATHYGLGAEQEITRHVEISVEGFYKQLDHLVTQKIGNVGTGRAYGIETLLRYKPDARFFGWLAYTLSRSLRRDTPDSPERLSAFDQTHILTILGSYRIGRGWEFGSRFRLVSGSLVTPSTYGFYDENAGTFLPLQQYPPNQYRLPTFHQLDIRVDKTWQFTHWKLSAYLDVQNVYNAANVEGLSYNYDFTRRTYTTGLPIIPSLGLRGEL
jgi:TonB family protein